MAQGKAVRVIGTAGIWSPDHRGTGVPRLGAEHTGLIADRADTHTTDIVGFHLVPEAMQFAREDHSSNVINRPCFSAHR